MGKFELMALPYASEALEPVISRETIGFHHGKHLSAYVNNLNGLLDGSGFEDATLEEIVCKATGGILNNAGQILNHELYFGQFIGQPINSEPTGTLAEAISRDFGSFDAFNPNRSLGPISSGDVKVFSCSPESKECLPLIYGSHKT